MKRTVLTFGLISGAIVSVMMATSIWFLDGLDYRTAEVLGYTSIVLAMLVTFFGVRSYREQVTGGRLTFGRGLAVGLLITLITCSCYVVTWQVLYYGMPGLGDKMAACMVRKVKDSGASEEKVEEARRNAESLMKMYENPAVNVALTFVEPFPIGLAVSLISAAVLRKKARSPV
jgi:hypothetical protein